MTEPTVLHYDIVSSRDLKLEYGMWLSSIPWKLRERIVAGSMLYTGLCTCMVVQAAVSTNVSEGTENGDSAGLSAARWKVEKQPLCSCETLPHGCDLKSNPSAMALSRHGL